MVAGTSSGVGKTTVATGLMAALRARGVKVANAKVGPDFIDPGYHALATGRPPRNLDSWICGEDAIGPLAGRAGDGADVLVIEGVMGLFDGAALDGPEASTASIARLLDAPILLVVDASAMSGSVAPLVHGFATFDPQVRVAGVVLNQVGSDGHEDMLRRALTPSGIPVVGALRRDDALTWRDRHLGLVPVVEHAEEVRRSLARLAALVAEHIDLDAVLRLAAAETTVGEVRLPRHVGPARIAVATGAAFDFVYRDNLEALEAAGAELLPFDPLHEAVPAGATGLYAGGGFPEVFAEQLAANRTDLGDLVTWAECGGLLWLSRRLDGHELAGVVDAEATMTRRLTLGYRRALTRTATPFGPAGTELRGHEFRYSAIEPAGDALELHTRNGIVHGGFATPRLLASYLHLHLGGDPAPGEAFVRAALP